jgi:hypothetical protein
MPMFDPTYRPGDNLYTNCAISWDPDGGWTAKQIHQAVLTTFHLSDKGYGLNQLRYT